MIIEGRALTLLWWGRAHGLSRRRLADTLVKAARWWRR